MMRATCLNEHNLQNKACVSNTVLRNKRRKWLYLAMHLLICVCARAIEYLWSSEDNLWERALSFHYVDSGDQTQPGLASAFLPAEFAHLPRKEMFLLLLKPVSYLGFRFRAYRL